MKTISPLPGPEAFKRAFTLVETLVAVAILCLLMVSMIQISAVISGAWRKSQAMADNYAQARLTLWLIEQDVQAMILRSDLASFVDAGGTTACAFYTEVVGGGGSRPASLVSYSLNATTHRLQRGDHSLDYSTLGATLGTTGALPDLSKVTQEDLVDGVVLFQLQFLNTDGTLGTVFDSTKSKSLIVSIAVLDATTAKLVEQNKWLPRLQRALGGGVSPGETWADSWNRAVEAGDLKRDELAAPILSGLRIYSKIIPFPST